MANVGVKLDNFMMRRKLNSAFLVWLIAKNALITAHVNNALQVLS